MWLIKENEVYEIVGFNIREFEDDSAELWATKTTGKTVKISVGTIEEIKRQKVNMEYSLVKGDKTYDIV